MSKASMARAIAKAGKKQEAQTRGLTGNRNAQGDFMTGENKLDTDRFAASEMMARDNTVDAVTPDLQNYIEDVKAQIDDLEKQIDNQEAVVQDPTSNQEASSSELAHLQALYANKEQLVDDLITKLEDNGIPVPEEVRDLQLQPYDRDLKQNEDAMKKYAAEEQAYEDEMERAYRADPDPTGGWAEWNSM